MRIKKKETKKHPQMTEAGRGRGSEELSAQKCVSLASPAARYSVSSVTCSKLLLLLLQGSLIMLLAESRALPSAEDHVACHFHTHIYTQEGLYSGELYIHRLLDEI